MERRLIVLYNILLFIVLVVGFPLIVPAILISDKRRKTVLQRLGLAAMPAGVMPNRGPYPAQKPIWIHALSVGEVLSAVPLIKEIATRFDHRKVFVSVSTKTGFEIASKHFRKIADAVFYYPYDLLFSVKHMTGKVDPALVVIVESDIWPNFLFELRKRNVPVVLVNARLSRRSLRGYKRFKYFSKPLFLFFAHICTQSLEDARRFRTLDFPSARLTVTGNIKFEQEFSPLPMAAIEDLRQQLQLQPSQKILLAGSTHKGEEEILLEAYDRMKRKFDDLLLIVAPRDPERAGSVQRIFQSAGLAAVSMKSLDQIETANSYDVIVVDTIGVLKSLYALADVAFIGGSLVHCGGHNPLEPAMFSKPILFGYDMSDFAEIADMLVAESGAVRVRDAESLYHSASKLLKDDQKAKEMGQRALKVFADNKGAVDKTLKVLEECL